MFLTNRWEYFKEHHYVFPEIGLQIDNSLMQDPAFALDSEQEERMFAEMQQLEKGARSNVDENRMVGHYWLRQPRLAPSEKIRSEIEQAQKQVQDFAGKVLSGKLCGEHGQPFRAMLMIGIGGSILGPCFVVQALRAASGLKAYFMDNTDPDGIDQIFSELENQLDQVLVIVVSKSGSTLETRNGMTEAQRFYQKHGLHFSRHAVAITQEGSQLYQLCQQEHWLGWFPIWDWVGGRTSVTSAVGLLPLALAGADVQTFLRGAQKTDECTRIPERQKNPAALLAANWYAAWKKCPSVQMVILPYKDRLELLTPYLQQLIMESLGKEKNRQGETVHQGIAVWGRKGSSDQHSYMQQLLDGPDDFFLTFIEILQDRAVTLEPIADESTSGDFLQAFMLGCREALRIKERSSLTLTLPRADAFSLGVLIALYERAVGFYAELAQVNAYNQPAVELGKKSAGEFIALKNRILGLLRQHPQQFFTVEELALQLEVPGKEEWIFKLLQHLTVNHEEIQCHSKGEKIWDDAYAWFSKIK